MECLWCKEEENSSRRLEPGELRQCPLCDHVFKGHGWDGIDAHWKAKHETSGTPYRDFWQGISGCIRHAK